MKEVQKEILQGVANNTLSKGTASLLLHAIKQIQASEEPIAVIGIGGRWPNANNIDELWTLLCSNEPQLRPFPSRRQRQMYPWISRSGSAKLQVGAFLDNIIGFDAEFFGLSKRDAELIDPVQRVFIEASWLALQDAVSDPNILKGHQVGVFVGYSPSSDDLNYWQLLQQHAPELSSISFTGNLTSMLAGRVSHLWDLRGPSIVIDTACSSSLVAIHQACQSLRMGECELALAGGVKLHLYPQVPVDSIGIDSSDGLTRAFAGGSGGTGIGEGVAAVVLKPLSKALKQGDRIYAVIAGSASNQDGRTSDLTVPNVRAQQAVVESAWKQADIDATQIGYIEAHGTGTLLGDPIEFESLTRALKTLSLTSQPCALGSSKTIFGHLDSAAGITGFIKAVLMVYHKKLLPNANFNTPNERIDYLGSPLFFNDRLRPWPLNIGRHCGVSAFSLSGTNCHVVLRPAPSESFHSSEGSLPFTDRAKTQFNQQDLWFATEPQVDVTSYNDLKQKLPSNEDILTRVWRDVLGDEAVIETVDFFAAGGNSLKAAILTSRLTHELNQHISVGQIWLTPTLGALRKFLKNSKLPVGIFIPSYSPQTFYPLTVAQRQMYLHTVMQEDTLYNVPFGLYLTGTLDLEKLQRCAVEIVEADKGLCVRFGMRNGQVVIIPSDETPLQFDSLRANDPISIELAIKDFIRPFNVQSSPLVRMRLIIESTDHYLLLMDFHHLIMDGVSVAIFLRRLKQAYQSADNDIESHNISIPIRTSLDFSLWFADRLKRNDFNSACDFWRKQFLDRPSGILAALSTPQNSLESIEGDRHTFTLDEQLSKRVFEFAKKGGHGLFSILMGAFSLALYSYSQQKIFNIGSPFSGRSSIEIEETLGMFVNLLPMPIEIEPTEVLVNWLQSIRTLLASFMNYQDCPIEILAEESKILRDAVSFNVAFALQNMSIERTEFGKNLYADPLPFYNLPWNVAKFDLTLFAMEIDNQLVFSFERRVSAISHETLQKISMKFVEVLQCLINSNQDSLLSECLDFINSNQRQWPVGRLSLKF
ncbi:condensation domain-containing protein [Acinetobacter calcoaceticus]